MKLIHFVLGVGLCFGASAALAQSASSSGAAMAALTMPAAPAPVAVTLDAAKTALLLADMVGPTCGAQPRCTSQMVPAIAGLLAKARKAGVYVLYTIPRPGLKVLPSVAPTADETTFVGHAQDRFYHSKLDAMLKAKAISTLVLVGWKVDGSVLFTSVAATLRGYTVVVPQDASLAPTDYDVAIGRYLILNQLSANASNAPLKPKASTLSLTRLIAFK